MKKLMYVLTLTIILSGCSDGTKVPENCIAWSDGCNRIIGSDG